MLPITRWVRMLVVCLSFFCGVHSLAAATKPTLIFICSGQSNMDGHGEGKRLAQDEYLVPKNLVTFDLKKSRWYAPTLTSGKKGRIGPDFSFGIAMAKAFPRETIGLVKFAKGGTSLLAWAPEWSETEAAKTDNVKAGPLYHQLMTYVQAAQKTAPRATVAGVIWMQGEREAKYVEVAQEYRKNIEILITSLRKDLAHDQLPFAIGQIKMVPGRDKGSKIVRDAQARAAQQIANSALVSTDEVTLRKDNIHYDAAGQILLGQRFAEAMQRLLETGKRRR